MRGDLHKAVNSILKVATYTIVELSALFKHNKGGWEFHLFHKELSMLKEMDLYSKIAFILVLVGGICWGLVGLFGFYLVTTIFGGILGRIIYIVVGVGAGWLCYKLYLEMSKKTV
jgi:uncharacterized membrane protein YuzA (DUF378 family)